MVIGENVEEQLAPYDEDISVEPYRKYEDNPQFWMDLWKRRDEPATQPQSLSEALLDFPGTPPLSIDQIPNPDLDTLVTWLNERYDDEEEPWGYDEQGLYQMSTYNPKSKWDWYTVGGRWSGFFKLKSGVMDQVGAVAELGGPGAFGNQPRYDADHVLKRDVDVEWMRDEAGKKAGERWDRVHAVIAELPPALSWPQVMDRHKDESGNIDIDAARGEYHAQERVKAVVEHDSICHEEGRYEDMLGGWSVNVEDFQVTREAYVQDARDGAIVTYAYLKDGEWHAPGEMGWWGVSSDTTLSRQRFERAFNEMFDALPDDTRLTLVDCHI